MTHLLTVLVLSSCLEPLSVSPKALDSVRALVPSLLNFNFPSNGPTTSNRKETVSAKALSLLVPRVFKEQQGGQHGWGRAAGRTRRKEAGEVMGGGTDDTGSLKPLEGLWILLCVRWETLGGLS